MTPSPQANTLVECPELEEEHPKDMGDLLGVCISTAYQYHRCKERHKALIESVKPKGFWDAFK